MNAQIGTTHSNRPVDCSEILQRLTAPAATFATKEDS